MQLVGAAPLFEFYSRSVEKSWWPAGKIRA